MVIGFFIRLARGNIYYILILILSDTPFNKTEWSIAQANTTNREVKHYVTHKSKTKVNEILWIQQLTNEASSERVGP